MIVKYPKRPRLPEDDALEFWARELIKERPALAVALRSWRKTFLEETQPEETEDDEGQALSDPPR